MAGPTSTDEQLTASPRSVARLPERPATGVVRDLAPKLNVRSCGHGDTGSRVDALVTRVRALYGALRARPGAAPDPVTNDLFGRLVALAIEPHPTPETDAVLDHPAVARLLPDLRCLCAAGEFELERHWAERVISHPDPRAELGRFPYDTNYRDLTRLERHALAGLVRDTPRRVLFIGSGPLPLTPLLWAERYDAAVDCVDIDPDAVRLGRALVETLGVGGLRFVAGDALASHRGDLDLESYDLVYVAALAGLEGEEKAGLLAGLARRLRPGTLVLARSAHGLRRLLYPVLDPDDLPGLETLSVVHPYTDVVNSVVIAQVAA